MFDWYGLCFYKYEVVDVFLRSGIVQIINASIYEYSIWLDSLNLRVMEKRLV